MNARLELYTLGGLNIQLNGISSGEKLTRKAKAMLLHLAIEPSEHSRESLATMLWGDLDTQRALANLRITLFKLQKDFEDFLVVTRQTISLDSKATVWVDATHLHATIVQSRQEWFTKQHITAEAPSRLAQALTLYRGPFLDDLTIEDCPSFEQWKLDWRETIRSGVIDSYKNLIDDSIQAGKDSQGIGYARTLLAIDPLADSVQGQLMLMLARCGQSVEALSQYEQYAATLKQLHGLSPSSELVLIRDQVVKGNLTPSSSQGAGQATLPEPSSPFIARPAELAAILDRLRDPNCHLLTLSGVGGSGKTRLAIQAADDYAAIQHCDVYFISFESVDTLEFVIPTIAAALKINVKQGTPAPLQRLERLIITRLNESPALLLIDNLDVLFDGVEYLGTLLTGCPQLKILITSRERLNLLEEWVVTLQGMNATDALSDPHPSPAVQLFLQTVHRLAPEFDGQANLEQIVRICNLVEGLPLAIELAASWIPFMTCEQIANEIEHDLTFLRASETQMETHPERHRQIAAMLEQTWKHLDDDARTTMRWFSIFDHPADYESILAITQSKLQVLGTLVDRCILRVEPNRHYSMHTLLRRFSRQKLEESGELIFAGQRLCDYYITFLSTLERLDRLYPDALERCDEYYNHLRSALSWCRDHQDAERLITLCQLLEPFWIARGYVTEQRFWLESAFDLPSLPDNLRGAAHYSLGAGDWLMGNYYKAETTLTQAIDFSQRTSDKLLEAKSLLYLSFVASQLNQIDRAKDLSSRSLAIAQELDNDLLITRNMGHLGIIHVTAAEYDIARPYLTQAISQFEALDYHVELSSTLANLGVAYFHQGYVEDAKALYERSRQIGIKFGHEMTQAYATINLAEVAMIQGELDVAYNELCDGIRFFTTIGDNSRLVSILENFSNLADAKGEVDRAITLWAASANQRKRLNIPILVRERVGYDQYLIMLKSKANPAQFEKSWEMGTRMSLQEAVRFSVERSIEK